MHPNGPVNRPRAVVLRQRAELGLAEILARVEVGLHEVEWERHVESAARVHRRARARLEAAARPLRGVPAAERAFLARRARVGRHEGVAALLARHEEAVVHARLGVQRLDRSAHPVMERKSNARE